jgi:hypothetical protein
MSSPIDPTQATTATKPTSRIAAVSKPAASITVQRIGPGAERPADGSVSLETIPANPPQEVLDQVTRASQRFERISAEGKQLRFVDGDDRAPSVLEVRDADGQLEQRLSLAEAFDLATGEQE